jgi:FixJ family two-component response regulator
VSRKPLISIVDDDESVREATQNLMEAQGFVAEAFASAEEFLNSQCLQQTSCLIADIQMPGMSGLELHTQLNKSGHKIPMILITAYYNDRTRARAVNAGVICYLKKPFSENELLGCIHAILGRTCRE